MLKLVSRNRVSTYGVGIALVSTDSLSVSNNINTFDLSHRIPENRLNRLQNFPIYSSVEYAYNPKTRSNNLLLVTPDLESAECLITNKAAIRPDLGNPIPLFYKYHLGKGIHGVYQRAPIDADNWRELVIAIEDANAGTSSLTSQQVSDIMGALQSVTLSILDNITVTTRLGAPTFVVFSIARIFPVFIDRMSEHYGAIFDVTIYTSETCSNGTTLMVNYQGYDFETGVVSPNVSEVLNGEPIHEFHSSSYQDTMQLDTHDATLVAQKQHVLKFILDE